jgi:hypothetical protein
LFFLIAETLNINHSNPITAVDLLKKSYLGQIMVMRIVPVTKSEIINIIYKLQTNVTIDNLLNNFRN